MFKAISPRPAWLEAATHVERICSVSGCFSESFAEFIKFWRHNGYWFFDSPAVMREIAKEQGVDLGDQTLFFYKLHPLQYDQDEHDWKPVEPNPSFPVAVIPPRNSQFLGFDVVTYYRGNAAECSPLSCNSMAAELTTNADCLFDHFEDAKSAIESGKFDQCEPGPYRILAVYRVDE